MVRSKRLNVWVATTLLAMLFALPRVAHVQDSEATAHEFWGGGEHYQLDSKAVSVAEDGIHDPKNDAVSILQEPVEAMEGFPRDKSGVIDWVQTLQQGLISPRMSLYGDEEMFPVDFDVIFKNTGSMPFVRYPHLAHTEWLTCVNCHPKIFLPQQGGNPVTMSAIIQGDYCGVCHGKVAFPPTKNCGRCHSVTRESVGLR
jgi:c(7)-type cytochrome triheme protein